MKRFLIALSIVGVSLCGARAQALQNGDFSKGKAGWTGGGVVVFLDTADKILPKEEPGSKKALKIDLRKTQWTSLKQTLRPLAKDTAVSVSFQVKALADFLPAPESSEYSKVDFTEGGTYAWSAEVWPKCDLLVRLQDSTWHYRLFSLKPLETWKTFNVSFSNLSSRNRSFTIALPPCDGSVLLREIK